MAETPEAPRSSDGRTSPLLLALGGIGGVSAIVYTLVYAPLWPDRGAPALELRLAAYPVLFALYFLAVFLAWRWQRALLRGATVIVVAAAVASRAVVLSGPVTSNSDNWRYLWEGRALLSGMNPYAAPPGSAVYDDLRLDLLAADDPVFQRLPPEYNDVRSVYGPVATALFVLPHLAPWDRIWTLRLVMAAFDLGTALVLMGLLRALARAPALALVYAWNPMCLSAFADRAQADAPTVFFVAVAVWLLCVRRSAWAGAAFGIALLVKVSPVLLVLPLGRYGRARFVGPLAAVVAVGLVPLALAGPAGFSGFVAFASRWRSMDSLHGLVFWALRPLAHSLDASAAARVLVALAAVGYAVWRTGRGVADRPQWLLEACAFISGAGLLLSPVVHPWYAAHLLIFLCFVPSPGLVLLTCATMAWFLRFWEPGGVLGASLLAPLQSHREPWRWLAYPPVYALLVAAWLRGRWRRDANRRARTSTQQA